jgi:hypothetical protein
MKKISRLLGIFFVTTAFLVVAKSSLFAATLQLISAGGTDIGVLITVNTTDTTPTLIGKASPEATVDITIDDLTVAVLADASGDWSYTPITALSDDSHGLALASNLETLNYILIVDSGSSSTTTTTTTSSSSTTTTGGIGGATESSSATLPVSGGVESTFLMVVGGIFLMGLGLVTQQMVPAVQESEELFLEETPE